MVIVLCGFGTGVLELLDDVLVFGLHETAALVGIEVVVIDKETGVAIKLERLGEIA